MAARPRSSPIAPSAATAASRAQRVAVLSSRPRRARTPRRCQRAVRRCVPDLAERPRRRLDDRHVVVGEDGRRARCADSWRSAPFAPPRSAAELSRAPANRGVRIGHRGAPRFRCPSDGSPPDERTDRRGAHAGVRVGGRRGQPRQRAGRQARPEPERGQLGGPPDRVPGRRSGPVRAGTGVVSPAMSRSVPLRRGHLSARLTSNYRVAGCPAYSRTQCRPRDRAWTRASTRAGIAAPASR